MRVAQKLLFPIGLVIFAAGFIAKFFYFPMNAIVMMAGLLLLLVASTLDVVKKSSQSHPLIRFAATAWLLALLFSMKFWPGVYILIGVAAILSVGAIWVAYRKSLINKLYVPLFAAIICFLSVTTPSDQRYYLMSVRWNPRLESDYICLDKYSWFLYQNGKYDQAEQISAQARAVAQNAADEQWIEFIDAHHEKIRARTWSAYAS